MGDAVILLSGENMENGKQVLTEILRTTQAEQLSIRSASRNAVGIELKYALAKQLQEYRSIEQEAYAIANARGWNIGSVVAFHNTLSDGLSKFGLIYRKSDPKIAGMLIKGITNGMIKTLKLQHHDPTKDARIANLTQKLLDCEMSGIRQMQGYV